MNPLLAGSTTAKREREGEAVQNIRGQDEELEGRVPAGFPPPFRTAEMAAGTSA